MSIAVCLIIKLTYSREEIYFAVNARNWPWADGIAAYVTDIGDGLTTIAIALMLLLFSYRKAFILIGSYALSSGIVAQSLKHLFDSPRPKLYFQDKLNGIHLIEGTNQLSLHSFPSGHTVTIFSTTLIIAYWAKDKVWGLPLFLLAVLVGFSRMYLSQHFFEDVTAGSAVGVVVSTMWLYWCENREFLKSPKWNKGLIGYHKKNDRRDL
ncbi:phosphatase PAP2 family protein [Mucilaginibacter antarcticus]|uniref:phosphatase PAP2 family protein n=1 Tax=Mucilaginibacter antarcticus TaxID=1855725 RepID=UPI00362F2A55